ncbi:APC family permease [Pseudanabaena sp. PCC 6802]|uniref:APC family permease n=1 Tax=Pseudanabaena sp. PCC 6802 TaxID=118173 RepID=UPI00034AE0BA|nr:amino acid permease [Pseudanabaena sp. PCC 6802]
MEPDVIEGKIAAEPHPSLTAIDAVATIVGIVVGAGIFKTPAIVAASTGSEVGFLSIWLVGGLISLVGVLCYAELATAYPHPGGEYHYLTRAFGGKMAWLFAWARLSVMQTGSIALLAFVFGDYFSQLLPLGEDTDRSASIYAACAVILLTALNAMGIQFSRWVQNGLTAAKILGLACVCLAGFTLARTQTPVLDAMQSTSKSYGLAAIFVLLTYGGWSEAAYISAELRDAQRNMTGVLVWSIAAIASIFMLVNLAYLKGLGLTAIARSDVVAAELMRRLLGETGAQFISLLIAVSVLGAMNGTIFTGARTTYALGRDFALFSWLGRWHPKIDAPINALLVQGAIALALVGLGTLTRQGFSSMVDYTAPVFWFFLLLVGLSLLVLRSREPEVTRPFRVPLYPLTPLLFCATCIYMLQASCTQTGIGAGVGIAALLVGLPILLLSRAIAGEDKKPEPIARANNGD